MLIAILIVAGIAVATKAAAKVKPGNPGADEYTLTGNAATKTHKFPMPDGSPTFTPAAAPNAMRTIPFRLLGMNSADPQVGIIRTTYINQKPTTGIVGMLAVQKFYNGGS